MDLMLLVAMFAIAAVPVRAQAQQFRKRIADARVSAALGLFAACVQRL